MALCLVVLEILSRSEHTRAIPDINYLDQQQLFVKQLEHGLGHHQLALVSTVGRMCHNVLHCSLLIEKRALKSASTIMEALEQDFK